LGLVTDFQPGTLNLEPLNLDITIILFGIIFDFILLTILDFDAREKID